MLASMEKSGISRITRWPGSGFGVLAVLRATAYLRPVMEAGTPLQVTLMFISSWSGASGPCIYARITSILGVRLIDYLCDPLLRFTCFDERSCT